MKVLVWYQLFKMRLTIITAYTTVLGFLKPSDYFAAVLLS